MDKEKRNARQARYRQQASRSRLEIMITPELLERFRSLQGLEEATNVQKLEALCNAWEATRAVKEVLPELEDPAESAARVKRLDALIKESGDMLEKHNKTKAENKKLLTSMFDEDRQVFASKVLQSLVAKSPKKTNINWDAEKESSEKVKKALDDLENLYGAAFVDCLTSGRVKISLPNLIHLTHKTEEARQKAIFTLIDKKQ